ncbi:MAG: hypothetical protein CL834_06175 [Crocinitomicaceae bacterium]|nr:hypothetical protein [Crocinitomicaceae bacterium]
MLSHNRPLLPVTIHFAAYHDEAICQCQVLINWLKDCQRGMHGVVIADMASFAQKDANPLNAALLILNNSASDQKNSRIQKF